MFSLSQVQSIFDYGLKGFYQAVDQKRQDAVQNAAKLASAATTVANKEAKMAGKTKQVVLTAGMEATVFNTHLSGDAFRVAFDRQFILSFKAGLEQLFGVENIYLVDKVDEQLPPAPHAHEPVALIAEPKPDDVVAAESSVPSQSSSYYPQQFFPMGATKVRSITPPRPVTPMEQLVDQVDGMQLDEVGGSNVTKISFG